ncbi:DUF3040 domain-containing protein [Actinoplanes couchii]|uniref:DUF3040 domain-containing protein n=1 Tax=Actinoplanes couchii TaxID=403638 RepID=A0ABQ3XH19_9ACTN|nr:DUF3040 domain-containing protein [Actinoplanes couchii]MDR6320733.1 hypothetical protein [Actinoplanes couchii]GID57782.1 hypothetical protein Aco03nite_061860 [Actinoplanes couchii]
MSTRDTRREFEEIVGRLAAEDPGIARPVRMLTRRVQVVILAVIGGLIWAGLSVAMVAWGAAGVALTCICVLAAVAFGVWFNRRRNGG